MKDEEFNFYFDPINNFLGIFSKRSKTKSGYPRFYLYSENKNKLILSAESHVFKNARYEISNNSNDFTENSNYYLGRLINHLDQDLCFAKSKISINSNEIKKNLIIKFSKNDQKINFLPNDFPNFLLDQIKFSDFNLFFQLFPNFLNIENSNRNILLTFNNICCFTFAQINKDEYFFYVSKPLSLFQGFCIAISIIRKIK